MGRDTERRAATMIRKFAAKLLWQYEVQDGSIRKKRICEERTVVFDSRDAEDAYRKAVRCGYEEECSWWVDEEETAKVERQFVGIVELLELSDWDDDEEFQEVWCELKDRVEPLERRERFIPPKGDLSVFRTSESRFHRGRVKIPTSG